MPVLRLEVPASSCAAPSDKRPPKNGTFAGTLRAIARLLHRGAGLRPPVGPFPRPVFPRRPPPLCCRQQVRASLSSGGSLLCISRTPAETRAMPSDNWSAASANCPVPSVRGSAVGDLVESVVEAAAAILHAHGPLANFLTAVPKATMAARTERFVVSLVSPTIAAQRSRFNCSFNVWASSLPKRADDGAGVVCAFGDPQREARRDRSSGRRGRVH